MRHHLEKVRRQPEHVRHIIAYTVTGVCTLALLLAWSSSLGELNQKEVNQFAIKPTVEQKQVNTLKTPWQAATANMANAFESVKGVTTYIDRAFGGVETYTAPSQYIEVTAE